MAKELFFGGECKVKRHYYILAINSLDWESVGRYNYKRVSNNFLLETLSFIVKAFKLWYKYLRHTFPALHLKYQWLMS